jgi:hypothetical protein
VYLSHIARNREDDMPPLTPDGVADTLESCMDAIGELLATLDRYDDATLAFGLRAHLAPLLQLMLERGTCTREEARGFLRELEDDVLSDEAR